MAARSAISLRYYLWADDGPWQITHQLHSDLVSGKIALRQYAGTKQKIIEVFIREVRGRTVVVEARGSFYFFDARGCLDVSSQAEAAAIAVESAKVRAVGLSELVADSLQTYEAMALNLAGNLELLASIRTKLASNLDSFRSSMPNDLPGMSKPLTRTCGIAISEGNRPRPLPWQRRLADRKVAADTCSSVCRKERLLRVRVITASTKVRDGRDYIGLRQQRRVALVGHLDRLERRAPHAHRLDRRGR